MKRVASYTKQLAKLDKKRTKIQRKLDNETSKLITDELRKAIKGREVFLRNLDNRRTLRRKPPVITEIDENNATVTTTLMNCLLIQDVANLIMVHMGPMELYIMTRVSKTLKKITTNATISLIPDYMSLYGRELTETVELLKNEEIQQRVIDVYGRINRTPCDYRALHLKFEKLRESRLCHNSDKKYYPPCVPIEQIIRDLHRVFAHARLYDLTMEPRPEWSGKPVYDLIHTFVHDKDTGSYTPLAELNLFRISKMKNAVAALDKRWEKKGYHFTIKDDDKLDFFTHSELTHLKLSTVKAPFTLTKEHVIVEDGEIRRLRNTSLSLIRIRTNAINLSDSLAAVYGHNKRPFFDYYEVRLELDRRASEDIGKK